VHQRIQKHREQEVRERPRGDDGRACAQRLGVERQVALVCRHRRLALVEHAHVAAERKSTEDELGRAALGLPAQQGFTKTYGKAQHLDTAGHGHAVVTIFMHGNEQAQRDKEGR
jgi:hypothetical protein